MRKVFLLLVIFFFVHQPSAFAQTPVFQTDFENVVKLDANTLNLSVSNWIEYGDVDGGSNGDGARSVIDSTRAHSGTKSLKLDIFDITKSRRAELNVWPPTSQTWNEISVSQWLYLPADFNLNLSGHNWYEFYVIFSEYQPGSDHYLRLLIEQTDRTKPIFNLTLGGRRPPSTSFELARVNNFNLPRGKWFNVHSYLKRHETEGAVKVWIDSQLVFNVSNVKTKGMTNFHMQPAKVYYDERDTTPRQMWMDDFKIYSGYVEPVASSPSPTPKPGDANGDGLVNGNDYVIWLNNYNTTTTQGASKGDFNGDGVVSGNDYVVWLNNYGK